MPANQRATAPSNSLRTLTGMMLLLMASACTGASTAAPALVPESTQVASPPTTGSGTPGSRSTAPGPTRPLELDAVSADRAMEHVRELAVTIGSRPTGTPKEKAAADYIQTQLRNSGYDVEQQPFEFPWEEDESSLTVEGGDTIAAARVVRSPDGTVAGELADAGDGNSLAENALPGNVALAERGGRTFEEKAAEAVKAGASALIVFNNRDGDFSGLMRNRPGIPVIAVSRADGLKLRDLLKQGAVRVNLVAQGRTTTIQSQNVIGRGAKQCAVVIGGHYDSVPESPGASDNATGIAVMLETARVAQPSAAARGLCFVAFGGEELGLHGSRAFVQKLDADQRNFMLGMVNLDMEGVGDSWRVTGTDRLVLLGLEAAQRAGLQAERFELPRGTGSDFESFQQANIPNIYPALLDDPLFHTPRDTADRVSPENLKNAARWTLAIVDDLTK